jgi:hypothetical protein
MIQKQVRNKERGNGIKMMLTIHFSLPETLQKCFWIYEKHPHRLILVILAIHHYFPPLPPAALVLMRVDISDEQRCVHRGCVVLKLLLLCREFARDFARIIKSSICFCCAGACFPLLLLLALHEACQHVH